jgi:hypothetical protein
LSALKTHVNVFRNLSQGKPENRQKVRERQRRYYLPNRDAMRERQRARRI